MFKNFFSLFITIFVFTILCGCSSHDELPVTPYDNVSIGDAYYGHSSEHDLWGVWDIHFDVNKLTAEVSQDRNTQIHFDITDMILPPACDDCLEIKVNSFDPVSRVMDVDVTLRNQKTISGYDVRGILYTNDYGHLLINADAWTGLWEIPGGMDINPFRAFAKDEPNRIFAGGAEHTENYLVAIPTPPAYFAITFAVDASWPGNCSEPYAMDNVEPLEGLFETSVGKVVLGVEVKDWQDDIDMVRISAPEITGEDWTGFAFAMDGVWSFILKNNMQAPAGDYSIRIAATSENSGAVELYDIATLTIHEKAGWVNVWGSTKDAEAQGVAVDNVGNIYVTGYFIGTVDFDPGPGVDEHTADLILGNVYLYKYDPEGNFIWVRTWGADKKDWGYSVAVSGTGIVYATGYFSGVVDFDPGPGVDERDASWFTTAYLRAYDTNGNYLGTHTWGWEWIIEPFDVAVDDIGNVYVTGYYEGTIDFDPTPAGVDHHMTNGGADIFLSAFGPTGNFKWARTWGGIEDDEGKKLAVDTGGNIYVAGFFGDTVDFDPDPVGTLEKTSNGETDACLGKFNSSGELITAIAWGGVGEDRCSAVDADGENIYVTGMFTGTADLNPDAVDVDEHTSYAEDAIFLSVFNQNCEYLWGVDWGGSPHLNEGLGVETDGSGNIYVTGKFCGTGDFDPGAGVDMHTGLG